MVLEQRSDVAEWSRALDGDERAYGLLFDRHHHRVFRRALQLTGVAADADEVMAAAFFELWRRRADVRLVDGSVLPWLLATAALLSRNRIRGTLRYRRVLDRLPREVVEDAAETAAEHLEQAEQRRRIVAALREVSAQDAALLVLTVLDGLSAVDAGEVLRMKPGAARMRLSRVRGRLRGLLADLDPREDDGGTDR